VVQSNNGLLTDSARIDRIIEKLSGWGYPVALAFVESVSNALQRNILAARSSGIAVPGVNEK